MYPLFTLATQDFLFFVMVFSNFLGVVFVYLPFLNFADVHKSLSWHLPIDLEIHCHYLCKYYVPFSVFSSSMTFITGILEILNVLHDSYSVLFCFSSFFPIFCFSFYNFYWTLFQFTNPVFFCLQSAVQPIHWVTNFRFFCYRIFVFLCSNILLKSPFLHLYFPYLSSILLNTVIMCIKYLLANSNICGICW